MNRLRIGVFWAALILIAAFSLWQRFTYPHLTETQLFLKHWYVYILMAAGAFILKSLLKL